jgi:bacterioferritin-associated ferredoxin
MYVCICHAVTDRDIKSAVDSGVSKFQDLAHKLHVAQQCGICAKAAKECFNGALQASSQTKRGE